MFLTTWYFLSSSKTLKRNQALRIQIDGVFFVVFRTNSGRVCAIEDRCLHRHVPLSSGRVKGERIVCPYHGWQYTADGCVALIPALGEEGGLPQCRLKSLEVFESQGFVWGRSEGDGQAQPPVFVHFEEKGWTSFVMHSTFEAGVEACLENFLDCPHAAFVHRYWFRTPTARPVRAVFQSLSDGAQVEYFEEPREKSVVWRLLAPAKGDMRHTDRFIAPSISRVDYEFPSGLAYVITSHCTPVTANRTQVVTVISFKSRFGWLTQLFFRPLSRRILQQDIDMLALQAKNRGEQGFSAAVSTPADLLGPSIWAWRRAIKRQESTDELSRAEEHHATLYL